MGHLFVRVRAIPAVLLMTLATAACTPPDEVGGSDRPPAAWGALEMRRFGCTDVSGLYEAAPAEVRDAQARHGSMWPFPPGGGMQYWISGPSTGTKGRLVLHTRPIGPLRVGYPTRDAEWRSRRLANSEWTCKSGWIVLSESSIGLPSVTQWHGGSDVRVGARLGRFADGSLAVGQWTRVTGRGGSIGWGDTTFLKLPDGDRVVWHWQKLARIGAGDEAAAPPPSEMDRERR